MPSAMIDWQRCILNIRTSGLSVAELARQVGADAGTLNRIARGDTKRVEFFTGHRLLNLHLERCPKQHGDLRCGQ